MKDQVEQIRQDRNFEKVYYLNSELSLIDREKIIDDCKNGDIDILYLSPELLLSYDITYFIGDRHLELLVVDEAHLITTWGRDFRVDYWFLGQHVNKIRKNCGYKFPMVAVTATAIYGGDNDMVFDSVNSLYMHDPHLYIGEVKRNNITFVIDNHER
jgi:superfamily II DNA helicase RecQ